jgi:hypothetical protein
VTLACAGAPPAPPRDAAPGCVELRDRAVRTCVDGFRARTPFGEERPGDLRFALEAACPYAGAVAWSGCERGSFERFDGRSELGRCGDVADYVETAIELSCLHRHEERPLAEWNALVKRCFEWALAGSGGLRALCLVDRAEQRGL